jgi:hypothetical protein
MTEEPAFEIWNPETDHRIKIYASGRTEGIEGPRVLINRIPLIVSEYQRLKFGPELP